MVVYISTNVLQISTSLYQYIEKSDINAYVACGSKSLI